MLRSAHAVFKIAVFVSCTCVPDRRPVSILVTESDKETQQNKLSRKFISEVTDVYEVNLFNRILSINVISV